MNIKAKERRAALDQVLTARASVTPTERPALPPRHLGPIAEQANLYAEHVAIRAKQYDEAKAQGRLLLQLDPKTIRPTQFQNRHERSLLAADKPFAALKQSIATHGQETPIRVRPVKDALPYEFEIVAGHRRHAACLALDAERAGGFPIIAVVDAAAVDTRDLVMKMYRENAERADLSPYETGVMFQQWIDAEIFPTQAAIGEAIGQSAQNVGKYVGLATLPAHMLQAFGDPREIALRWSTGLMAAAEKAGPEVQTLAEELARRTPPPKAEEVFEELTALTPKRKGSSKTTEAIKEGNKTLFELSASDGRFAIRLGKHVDKQVRKALQRELKEWLHSWLKNRNSGQSK